MTTEFQTLVHENFPDRAYEIIDLVSGYGDPEIYDSVRFWVHQCYHKPSHDEMVMCALNEILEGYGVEAIREEDAWVDNFHMDIVAVYVNMGDSYTATILLDHEENEYFVTSYGDWVESREQGQLTFDWKD